MVVVVDLGAGFGIEAAIPLRRRLSGMVRYDSTRDDAQETSAMKLAGSAISILVGKAQ
jgi:hypothetical protein